MLGKQSSPHLSKEKNWHRFPGRGGTLQPHSLAISVFSLGLGGGAKVFYPPQTHCRRFKIPSFTSPGHTHSPVCAPRPPFLSAELWVIRYHLGNIGCEQSLPWLRICCSQHFSQTEKLEPNEINFSQEFFFYHFLPS